MTGTRMRTIERMFAAALAIVWAYGIAGISAYCPIVVDPPGAHSYHVHPVEVCRAQVVVWLGVMMVVLAAVGAMLVRRMRRRMRVVYALTVLLPSLPLGWVAVTLLNEFYF